MIAWVPMESTAEIVASSRKEKHFYYTWYHSPVINICTFLSELTIRAARSVPTIAASC